MSDKNEDAKKAYQEMKEEQAKQQAEQVARQSRMDQYLAHLRDHGGGK